MKDVAYGLAAGALGAIAWAAVVYFTEYEIGWIAWGVGAVVGLGVALGNADRRRSPTAAGALAVGITALSIVAGKYLAVQGLMPSDDEIVAMFAGNLESEELLVSYVADGVAAEFQAEGRPVQWPAGVDPSNAAAQTDYPADVWNEAQGRWASLNETQRTEFRSAREAELRANVEANLPEIRAAFASGGFAGSFSPMDVIFFGLGMVTAWGMGSGKKSQEQIQSEYLSAIKLAMLKVMVADDEVSEEECHAAAEILHEMTGEQVTPESLRADAAVARSGGADLSASLAEIGPHLKPEGKAMVAKAALLVALADGEFAQEERDLVHGIARAIGLSDDEFGAVVSEVKRQAEAGEQRET